jgi:carbonic anhydrase
MTELDQFLQRNQKFAAEQSAAGTLIATLPQAMLTVRAMIICCADMRVDPAYILGIKLGEAVELRNIGGRVTPGLLEQMALLGRIGEVAGKAPGGGGEFHVIVLQHTDCGITRLFSDTAKLAHYFQIAESEVAAKSVMDPRAAVAIDVAALRAIPRVARAMAALRPGLRRNHRQSRSSSRAGPNSQRIEKVSVDAARREAHTKTNREAFAQVPAPNSFWSAAALPPLFPSRPRRKCIQREAPTQFSRHQKPAVILRSAVRDEESHPCSRAQTTTTNPHST